MGETTEIEAASGLVEQKGVWKHFLKIKGGGGQSGKSWECISLAASPVKLATLRERNLEFQKTLNMEETVWGQKASCKRLLEEDKNSKIFHSMVKRRRLKSKISSIEYEGETHNDHGSIVKSTLAYYGNMLIDNIAISEEPILQHIQCL